MKEGFSTPENARTPVVGNIVQLKPTLDRNIIDAFSGVLELNMTATVLEITPAHTGKIRNPITGVIENTEYPDLAKIQINNISTTHKIYPLLDELGQHAQENQKKQLEEIQDELDSKIYTIALSHITTVAN